MANNVDGKKYMKLGGFQWHDSQARQIQPLSSYELRKIM
jgi:hypothetical protein